MTDTIKSYIGVGRTYARRFGTTDKLRFVGNVGAINLKHKLKVEKQQDYTRSGGGTAVRVERIEEISCDMTWLTFSAENMALAMSGAAVQVAAGTVVGETVKAHKGTLATLAHPPSSITSVTPSGGGTAYVVGTDYELSAGGLMFPETSAITEAANVLVSYAHAAYDRIEGAMGTTGELELFFEGLNEADSDKPALVDLWRVSMPSADEISLIGDKLGEMKFQGELLKDGSKGSGVSAFYRSRMVS